MTDLNDLQFFVRVSQTQSFTRAAKRLGVPKSAVSRAIVRLETRLGVQLLERTTRSVRLTELGELYLERCQRVLEEAEQAELVLDASQSRPRGTLRIAAPVAFARLVLGPVLGEFLANHSELSVRLQLVDGEMMPGRDVDLVIHAGPLEDSSLLVRPLMRIGLGMYASPAYQKERGRLKTPEDLRRHRCITTSCGAGGAPAASAVWRLCRGVGANREVKEIRVDSRVSVPDPTINHQLALSGAGIALLSELAAREDVEEGRLVRVLPEWKPDPVALYALYPSRLASSPSIRAMLDFLRTRFPHEPPPVARGRRANAGSK